MASTQSAAFGNDTQFINLSSDADVYLAVGVSPTATTTIGENGATFLLKGTSPIDVGVEPGWKVAGITSAGTAAVQVIEYGGSDHHGNQNALKISTVQLLSATT